MDKFQIFNRELKSWEDKNISIISGWNENFVQDKTTDSGKFKIKYANSTAPKIEINDWCRILHLNKAQLNAYEFPSVDMSNLGEFMQIAIPFPIGVIRPDYKVGEYIIDEKKNLGIITNVGGNSISVKRYFVEGSPIIRNESGATYKKIALNHTNYINIAEYVDIYSEPSRTGYKNWYVKLKRPFSQNITVLFHAWNITFQAGQTETGFVQELVESATPQLKRVNPYFITENTTTYMQNVQSIAQAKYNEDKTGVIVYLEKPLLEDVEVVFAYYTEGFFPDSPVLRTQTMEFSAGETEKEYILPSYEHFYENDSYVPDVGACTPEEVEHTDYIYIPQNHEQYVIQDISKIEDIVNNEWDIQLELSEPINITQGIVCETKSHTNQIEKTVDIEGTDVVYKHRTLTHYSVLEKTLKLTPSNNDVYSFDNVNYSRFNNKSWFNRIKINNSNFLDGIPFNDETYNEPTLYNILLDKYDSSTGRTPVLYFDINGENDLPFNKERTEYILNFERQDGLDKEEIQLSELLEDRKEITESKTIGNYANGIVSNFDNLAPNTTSSFVSETLFAQPEIDSNKRTISDYSSQSSDIGIWVLKLPHTIKKVNKIKRITINSTSLNTVELVGIRVLTNAKTMRVLEEKQYNASSSTDFEQRKDLCWYKEGENVIHLNDYYYIGGTESTGYVSIYQVEYEPLISGRIDQNKDYEIVINQVDSQIDSENFGKYLVNYLNSMNKSDLTISKTAERWEDIKEVGSRVIDGNKTYLITNVGIQNRGYEYDVVYQLNENHFRKSDSIVAPQEIRKNIEIGINATKERKSVFPVKYSLGFTKQNNISNSYFIDIKMLFSSLIKKYQDEEELYPQIAYFEFKSKLFPDGALENQKIERFCELSRYNLGNSICFNMRYIDNAEAGKSKEIEIKHNPATMGFMKAPKNQMPILYTDPFGEFDGFDFKLINTPSIPFISGKRDYHMGSEEDIRELNAFNTIVQYISSYPLVEGINISASSVLNINNINYLKDMLDTFNWTFAIRYEADKQIIYCRNFFKNSILMSVDGAEIKEVRTYSQNMTENDFSSREAIETSQIDDSSLTNDEITITLEDELETAKCLALVDTNGNPVIIINDWDKINEEENFDTIKLYC